MTTDRETLAAVIGKANRPHLSGAAREAEDKSWLWLADVLLASDWLAAYITDREAAAWDAGYDYGYDTGHDDLFDLSANPFRFTPDTEGHDNATNKIPN